MNFHQLLNLQPGKGKLLRLLGPQMVSKGQRSQSGRRPQKQSLTLRLRWSWENKSLSFKPCTFLYILSLHYFHRTSK